MKNILIIIGHTRSTSLSHAIAEKYAKGARESGNHVKMLNLSKMNFDPVLHDDLTKNNILEPDLKKAQKEIMLADHLVFVYPTWWGTMPSLLKGFIDRVFIPGFAYEYEKTSRKFNPFPERLLKGKSARIITTTGGSRLIYMLLTNPGTWGMRHFVLYFSGVRPVRTTIFSKVHPGMDAKRVKKILEKAEKLGKRAA